MKSCEGKITLEESEHAVSTLHDNKSPGNDGLTSEFYKTFLTTFAQLLVQVYNVSFRYGELYKEDLC